MKVGEGLAEATLLLDGVATVVMMGKVIKEGGGGGPGDRYYKDRKKNNVSQYQHTAISAKLAPLPCPGARVTENRRNSQIEDNKWNRWSQ